MAPPSSLRSRRSEGNARVRAYTALRDAIVCGELHPGRQLSENELAELLGVSRTPIREALVRLRDDRLVDIVPQLGTFVTRISADAVADAQFIREALECSAVRLAAERADRSDVAALSGLISRQEQVRDHHDFDRFYVLDDEFHGALCELSGHGVAWSLAQRANGHLNRVRRLSLPQPRYLAEMVAEHTLVVDAVRRGDPDAAEAALRHHLQMVLSGLPAIREDHPDYFEKEA
ncbi:MAG TPA: GntR family transcriptional regulator [Solirubrobacteraceae bacterium]|nr:GntR family transcriptional regulator [Solirubrobacteraceae bacterium]